MIASLEDGDPDIGRPRHGGRRAPSRRCCFWGQRSINPLAGLIKQGASARVILISVVIGPAWRVQSADRRAGGVQSRPAFDRRTFPKTGPPPVAVFFLAATGRAGAALEGK